MRNKNSPLRIPELPKDPEPMMIINELSAVMRRAMTEKSRQLFGTDACREIIRELPHKDGITQLDLVKLTYYTPAAISISLQKLMDRGFVRREADPVDRRAVRVFITEEGRAANREMYGTIKNFDRLVMTDISQSDREELIRILLAMRENILPQEREREE